MSTLLPFLTKQRKNSPHGAEKADSGNKIYLFEGLKKLMYFL